MTYPFAAHRAQIEVILQAWGMRAEQAATVCQASARGIA
jgi:hypothetical protein